MVLHVRLANRQADLVALKARPDRLDKLPEAAAERDIRYLEARLRSAILVPVPDQMTEVAFGHRVTVRDGADHETAYEITGEDEADATLHRIAPTSPLARALLGALKGDMVIWRRPNGAVELEVLTIAPLDPPA